MSDFKDHFSSVAESYRSFRPRYPRALFDWLAAQAPATGCVWDCATGNGQAAVALADSFERVEATDASAEQIAAAEAHPKIRYSVAPAEASGLEANSADLITVAQAAHWFDMEAFAREAERVAKPGGIIAVISYVMCQVDPAIDALVDEWYQGPLVSHWPPERIHVDTAYRYLHLPFERIDTPKITMTAEWSADSFLGYLGTWSGVRGLKANTGRDMIAEIDHEVRTLWGTETRTVRWPLVLRVGTVH